MKSSYAVREIEVKTGTRYEVSGYDAKGKQHRKRFKTQEEAEGEIHRLEMADNRVVHNSLVVQTRLTHQQVAEAERCVDLLPDGISLTDAVQRLVKAWNAGEAPAILRDALYDHLDDMERRGCSNRSIQNARSQCTMFADKNDLGEVSIDQIVKEDIESHLDGMKLASYNSARTQLSGLWTFAKGRKWCKSNIVSEIPTMKKPKGAKIEEVTTLSIEQCAAMLKAAHADQKSLAWTAVAIFGGLRPDAELKPLQWKHVDLSGGEIKVHSSKTGKVRHVAMHPTLRAWLQLATGQSFSATRAELKHVKRAAGYSSGLTRKEGSDDHKADKGLHAWPQDVTRHTFGTMLYAENKSLNETADQMGNSPEVVERHYKCSLPKGLSERFWGLTPENVLGSKKLKAVG